jgi:hypothetical protein
MNVRRVSAMFLFCLASAAAVPEKKDWNVGMCQTRQRPRVSIDYIQFCIKNSPNTFPFCVAGENDPREAMWASQEANGKGAYFEVLDCSWHPGMNPREHPKGKGK